MTTYLLRVCAFKKDFENLCNAYHCRSLVFYDFEEALKMGKAIMSFQIAEHFKVNDSKSYYKKINDEFVGDCIDYIFEIEESDPEIQKRWKHSDRSYGDIENPYFINWEFDYEGKLTGRWFSGRQKTDDIIRACTCGSYDYRPGDEKADAGTRFQLGDIVCPNDKKEKRICVIGGTPLKEGKYFENNYTCEFVSNGYLTHYHPHESEIEKYSGDIPENLLWLSQYFKGEIKISDEDAKKIFSGDYSFYDEPSYKTIKKLQ